MKVPFRVGQAALTAVSALLVVLASPAVQGATLFEEVPVPAGCAALSEALGLEPVPEPARFLAELTRVIYETPKGASAASDARRERLVQYLASAESRRASSPIEVIPIPLSLRTWADVVFHRPVTSAGLFAAIIADRRAALLAYGLAALDDETLQFLNDHPALLERIYQRDAGVFAAFAGSLRIRRNAIAIPGGDPAIPLWEEAAGQAVARPEPFIANLLERDEGRLAYLFDTIAGEDAPARAFALGLWITDTRLRNDRFRALVVASHSLQGWVVPEYPFRRPPNDPMLALGRIPVDASGAPRGPSSRTFWAQSFSESSLPDHPARELKDVRAQGSIDAAWLLESILRAPIGSRAERLDQLAFGLRVFADADDAALPEALVAVRAFPGYRMLMLTLERMGATRPSTYAAAARQAARLSGLDAHHGFVALSQFQGALVILLRLANAHRLTPERAESLIGELCAVQLNGDGWFGGGVARWLMRSLAPSIDARVDRFDADLISALSGREPGEPATPQVISWEGRNYRVDLAQAEVRRLTMALARLGATPFARALEAEGIAEQIASPDLTLGDVQQATHRLERWLASSTSTVSVEMASRALHDLSKISEDKDVRRAASAAPSVHEAADLALADAMLSSAYALSLGDGDGARLINGNSSRRHDFGLTDRAEDDRRRTPWTEPAEQVRTGESWHVRGSLLGLDLGLSAFAIRRIALGAPGRAPALEPTERAVFTRSVALLNAFELRDTDRDAIVAAIERGRRRVASLTVDDARLDALADEIGLDGWRRRSVGWALVHNPQEAASFFSLAEFLELGKLPASVDVDRWGVAATSYNGCLCLVLAQPRLWRLEAGRSPSRVLATFVTDLNLGISEALAELRLPAALAKGVLAAAMSDYLENVRPLHVDDWLTLVRTARAISLGRVDDYVAALTINGPLVPEAVVNSESR